MEEVTYPLRSLKIDKQVLQDDWFIEGYNFVRFRTIENNSCFFNALLHDVSDKYRNSTDEENKIELVEKFKDQIIDYLTYESDFSIEEIGKKISKDIPKKIRCSFSKKL